MDRVQGTEDEVQDCRAPWDARKVMRSAVLTSHRGSLQNSPCHRISRESQTNPRESLVMFLNGTNAVLSSAPTSPTSSDGETMGYPMLPPPLPVNERKKRVTNRPAYSRWRRRAALMTQCSPFLNLYSRTHNTGISSPYHSDVSQSAPSSPTIDTYETVPLIDNMDTERHMQPVGYDLNSRRRFDLIDHRDSAPVFSCRPLLTDSSTDRVGDPVPQSGLFSLLQRLGIEGVWSCLVEHGISDMRQLSRLSKTELIDMGVTDAETRATLMTAAQLLTDQWLQCSQAFQKPLSGSAPNQQQTTAEMVQIAEKQNLHDSGCSSSNEQSGTTLVKHFLDYTPSEQYKGRVMNYAHQPFGLYRQSLCTPRPNQTFFSGLSRCTNRSKEGSFMSPTRQGVGQDYLSLKPPLRGSVDPQQQEQLLQRQQPIDCLPSDFNNKVNLYSSRNLPPQPTSATPASVHNPCTARPYTNHPRDASQPATTQNPKTPVGILRNARASGDGCEARRNDSVRRSSSAAPKTVKIDERSLVSKTNKPGGQTGQEYIYLSPYAQANAVNDSAFQTQPSATQITLSQILRYKLKEEGIDLTNIPYSNEIGQANVPLRLMQRYAVELNLDLITVALAIENERELRLREAERPVVSYLEDIRSQRFLNCDGIKTGNIEDFLIGVGLPMYIERLSQLKKTKSCFQRKSDSLEIPIDQLTAADLIHMSDYELTSTFGFIPYHIAWLRHEASVVPSVLLAQTTHTKHFGLLRMTPNINSLTRGTKHNPRHSLQPRKPSTHDQRQSHPLTPRHSSQNRTGMCPPHEVMRDKV